MFEYIAFPPVAILEQQQANVKLPSAYFFKINLQWEKKKCRRFQ